MDAAETINADIIKLYEQWRDKIKHTMPHLLSDGFSNIFCTGVTEDWIESAMRIFIVGEEATWKSRSQYDYTEDTELYECQKWIINDLKTQLDGSAEKHSSPFWRRIHKIKEAYPYASFCHMNIDCINSAEGNALKERDRKGLHSCSSGLVSNVIKRTNPTHIIFFGWHNTSLRNEFPELCKAVYPEKFGDTTYMKGNGYIKKTEYNGMPVVFTYHPSWLKANSDEYIDRIIEELSNRNCTPNR